MFKFKKIKYKIFTGYGLFMMIIIIQLFLTNSINSSAENAYEKLTKEIKPKVNLFNKYRNANKMLLLKLNNKVSNAKNSLLTNKIKQVSNVDFPYFRLLISKLKEEKEIQDLYGKSIDSIIENTKKLESHSININALLVTSKDYDDKTKIEKAKKFLEKATNNSLALDHEIALLERDYTKKSEQGFINLSNKLKDSSKILLLSTLFFIIIGLLFSLRVTRSILRPLKRLMIGAKSLANGIHNTQVAVLGNDEIAELTRVFNKMSVSLNNSFNDIKNKNKELEQFTYIASHDLQEPLQTLTGFVNLLNENYGDQFDEVGQKSLGYIKDAAERMSKLVKGLLDYGRIGKNPELIKIDCNTLLEEVKSDIASTIKDSGAILKIEKLPELYAYKTELRLLFQNLISNAIKFRNSNTKPIIEIFAIKDNGFTFAVKDNGIGIDEKFKKRIFAIFQRLHSTDKYKGTGIGLAHCNKIIELHKGEIWVESKPNHGSTFYFNIPNLKK
ncbi:Phytochrome-like protein cph1 [Polaribacter huanghezhanensis]|uniref:ATP-binding protein n=1 Tax=Polaribacter huanghezhanensis TaxID=1354726 RepID=UPI00264865E7|nr:ATP-binding protein [Polaribacter huanghezhanensis]WKD85317.1 Phytochrome-like protein cph1 [Polaribacter huanghezhanensis]